MINGGDDASGEKADPRDTVLSINGTLTESLYKQDSLEDEDEDEDEEFIRSRPSSLASPLSNRWDAPYGTAASSNGTPSSPRTASFAEEEESERTSIRTVPLDD